MSRVSSTPPTTFQEADELVIKYLVATGRIGFISGHWRYPDHSNLGIKSSEGKPNWGNPSLKEHFEKSIDAYHRLITPQKSGI